MKSRHSELRKPDEHPRGTLAIVGLFGLVFFVGWLILYFLVAGGGHPN